MTYTSRHSRFTREAAFPTKRPDHTTAATTTASSTSAASTRSTSTASTHSTVTTTISSSSSSSSLYTRKSQTTSAPPSLLSLASSSSIQHSASSSSMLCNSDDDEGDILSTALCSRTVLPLEAFYKAVTTDLLLCRNESFFSYLFSQIFSRKIKAHIDGIFHSYESLRLHFLKLRKAYFTHAADGLLRWGPVLSAPENGGREGYLAAHFVCATTSSWSTSSHMDHNDDDDDHDDDDDDIDDGETRSNTTLLVTDTMEISWVEGKDGEMRRISRFDRVTRGAQ